MSRRSFPAFEIWITQPKNLLGMNVTALIDDE